MSAHTHRQRARSRVAAFNFLSNISLDGTHRDTKFSIFHKKEQNYAPENNISQPTANIKKEKYSPKIVKKDGLVPMRGFSPELIKVKHEEQLRSLECQNPLEEEFFLDDGKTYIERTGEVSPSKRYRASSFCVGDKPKSSCPALHKLSISEDSPTDSDQDVREMCPMAGRGRVRHRSSTSSWGSGGKSSQRDVRFMKPGREKITKQDRVVLLSNRKAPFVIYSSLPYNRKSHHGPYKGSEPNRASMAMPGNTINMGSTDGLLHLGLLAVERREDGQDISYSQFLVPTKHHPKKVNTEKLAPQDFSKQVSESVQSSPGIVMQTKHPLLRSLSYDPTLIQRINQLSSMHEREHLEAITSIYDVNLLDDPELRSGKHRTLLTFPSYMTSVIDYVKPSDLKKELNEKFREKFPTLQISLSKLRSLKRDMRKIACDKCGTDLWVVAQAYVFFERMILKGLITKPNRKLVAAACLLLSAKLNDVKGHELTKLFDEAEDSFKVHRKDMIAFEFGVLIALEFALLTQDSEITTHFQRLLYTP